MSKPVIVDAAIANTLREIFGQGNVIPADASTGYFSIFFDTAKQADTAADLLTKHGFEEYVMQDMGGFVATSRPNIQLLLGNESQRSGEHGNLNGVAGDLLGFLASNKEKLKTNIQRVGK